MRRTKIVPLILAALLVVSFGGIPSGISWSESDSLQTGPYIDEVVFKVMPNQDQRINALLNGELEMDTSFFDPVHLQTLNDNPSVSVYNASRNGYGFIRINCEKYPLNISGLRRAIAFALDKEEIIDMHLDGFGVTHDSVVPSCNGFCAENEFSYHYYTAEVDIGNAILNDLNFTIDPVTGYRLAPNGAPFDINFRFSSACGGPVSRFMMYDALEALHINFTSTYYDFNEFLQLIYNHGDYDMYHTAINFYSNSVEWLVDEFGSENAGVYGKNLCNFRNATFDSWIDQLLTGRTFEEVYKAASEMQKILQYNVPFIVAYENTYLQGYRNDRFTGHVLDRYRYISGLWTMRNIHHLNGSMGGTVVVALSEEPESFNVLLAESRYSESILEELYSSLYQLGPNGAPLQDLAVSLLMETHDDNPVVIPGHTRFTIDLIRNATWTDGKPLTADDVVFTLNYLYELIPNDELVKWDWDLSNLASVFNPTVYQVVVEFLTESYWNFEEFAYLKILPKHIYTSEICQETQWHSWNPGFNDDHPLVTSGPFTLSSYDRGEYYVLSRNPDYYYRYEPSSTATTNTTTSLTNTTTSDIDFGLLTIGLTAGSTAAIMIVTVEVFRRRTRIS
ncbi:MAG: ABC transporter substrate-binding protein [Candidatus Thorarchaeota archaeon]